MNFVFMNTNLEQLLLQPRQCASEWLAMQAHQLSEIGKNSVSPTLVVFACLEARNAIEQLWCEILLLIHGGAISRQLFEQCRKRQGGFLAAIQDAEPKYRQLSKFTEIAMNLDSCAPCEGIAWDLRRLKRLWQSLSEYCHAQCIPTVTIEDSKWISKGHELVAELFTYFRQKMSRGATAILSPDAMTYEAKMIWEDFVGNRIDEEQVRIRLRVVQPLPRR